MQNPRKYSLHWGKKKKTTKMYFQYYFSIWSVANVARMNVKHFKWNGVWNEFSSAVCLLGKCVRTADLFILFRSHECEHSRDLIWCHCLQIQRGGEKMERESLPWEEREWSHYKWVIQHPFWRGVEISHGRKKNKQRLILLIKEK